MPLIKKSSKKAFEQNVKAEMEANPEPSKHAQNLAIAYSTQRAARKKKMALGGAVEGPTHSSPKYDRNPGTPAKKPDDYREPEGEYMGQDWSYGTAPARKPDDRRLPKEEYMADHFAYGGMAEYDGNPGLPRAKADDRRLPVDEYMAGHFARGGIAEAIMRKRKMMADGGEVDINENAEESGSSPYDDMNNDAVLKELYDDDQISDQPEDSNEIGDPREEASENKLDMVDAIRKKIKKKVD